MNRVDEFWAAFFGLDLDDLRAARCRVVPHAQLKGYQAAWIFRRADSVLISVPPEWLEQVQNAVGPAEETLSDESFVALFGDAMDKVIGPAYQGYLEATNFRPVASSARLLCAADSDALRELAAACDDIEWEHAGIDAGGEPNFGLFLDGRLVAAANCQMEGVSAAMPGLIVHPAYRGRGHAKAVLSAACAHGLERDFLMLYQTLVANRAAVAAAQSIGYQPYATHLALRLKGN
jgi:ribosomal protein S18 acetylase RimI-like enzyme